MRNRLHETQYKHIFGVQYCGTFSLGIRSSHSVQYTIHRLLLLLLLVLLLLLFLTFALLLALLFEIGANGTLAVTVVDMLLGKILFLLYKKGVSILIQPF